MIWFIVKFNLWLLIHVWLLLMNLRDDALSYLAMHCHLKMKRIFMRGLLWLLLFGFGYMALSLEPGYLDFDNLPDTNFSCVGKVIGGYYADLETNCQMFHVCTIGQLDEPMDIRFLCLNGTVFDQETRVCERIDEVDCTKSEHFYSLNLELYGNTQPPVVEDSPRTDPPIVIKASTTTTTTTENPKPKTTRTAYYTTATPSLASTANSKGIGTHHFPISSAPDIRFNPEEINISLNPGAAPSIRTKTSYQEPKSVVTTHIEFGNENKDELVHVQKPHPASTTDIPKSVVSFELTHKDVTPSDVNYGFNFEHQVDEESQIYQTEVPQRNYQYHNHYRPGLHGQFRHQFRTSTSRTTTRRTQLYHSNTGVTTYRNPYSSSLKPSQYHQNYNTEKPQRLQLPLPLLPTLPPLTFSTPAPFTLSRHIETKRFTNEHHSPPRIIISASASVSDASGRRLNYSLGTIGVTPILDDTPKSYDDYKEHDVVLDPFYRDVPKIKSNARRKKRSPQGEKVGKGEDEAVDVLRFLFNWYKDHEINATSTLIPPKPTTMIGSISSGEDSLSKGTEESLVSILPTVEPAIINDELYKEYEKAAIVSAMPTLEVATINDGSKSNEVSSIHPNFTESELFRRGSRYNIIGDVLSVTEKSKPKESTTGTSGSADLKNDADYVNDNYEPVVYKENSKIRRKDSTTHSRPSENSQNNADYVNDNYEPVVYKEHSAQKIEKNVKENEDKIDILSGTEQKMQNESPADLSALEYSEDGDYEYVDDNYEPIIYKEHSSPNSEKKINNTNKYSENFASTEKYKQQNSSKNITTMTKSPDTNLNMLNKDIIHDVSGGEEEKYTTTPFSSKTELAKSLYSTESYQSYASISDKDFYSKASTDDTLITNTYRATESSKNSFDKTSKEKSDKNSSAPIGFKFDKEYRRLVKRIFQNDEDNHVNVKTSSRIDNQRSSDDDLNSARNTLSPRGSLNIASKREKGKMEHDIVNDPLDNKNIDSSQNVTVSEDFETPRKAEEETTIFVIIKKATPRTETFHSIETKLDHNNYSQTDFNTEALPPSTDMSLSNIETNIDPNSERPSEVSTLEIDESDKNVPTEETTTENQQNINFEVSTSSDETGTENMNENDQKYTLTTNSYEYASTTESTQNVIDDSTTSSYDEKSTQEVTTPTNESLQPKRPPKNGEFYTLIATEFFDDITTLANLKEDIILTTSSPTTTKAPLTTARSRSNNRRNRPSNYKPRFNQDSRRFSTHHRFSSEHSKTRPNRRKPSVDEHRITQISTTTGKLSLANLSEVTTTVGSDIDLESTTLVTSTDFVTTDEQPATTDQNFADNIGDVPSTDAPLYKSANPTRAESENEGSSFLLQTTPLTMTYRVQVRRERIHSFVFNCFDKPINRYYSDPRDCRLFHYCTTGYTRNQLLDMKFVCDLGTYFDDDKLICTKTKPSRCL